MYYKEMKKMRTLGTGGEASTMCNVQRDVYEPDPYASRNAPCDIKHAMTTYITALRTH